MFLDEIGELPLELQPRLLRAIERNEVKPVGADQYVSINVRVICATHRCLEEEVEQQRFRLDLYYRLAVIKVNMPALRSHKEDIPGLVEHLLARLSSTEREVSYKTMTLLLEHDWPGNVRELKNYIQRAIALTNPQQRHLDTQFVLPHHLAQHTKQALQHSALNHSLHAKEQDSTETFEALVIDRVPIDSQENQDTDSLMFTIDINQAFKDAKSSLIDHFEQVYWSALMKKHHKNISAAARTAGIHRKSAEYIVKKLKLRAGDDDDV